MEKYLNTKELEEINNKLPLLIEGIGKTNNEITNYLENFKIETFERKEGEELKEAILRGENVLQRLIQLKDRRTKINENVIHLKEIIDNLNELIKDIEKKNENEKLQYSEANNEIIEKIIKLKEEKMKEDIKPSEETIRQIKNKFEKEKEQLMKQMENEEEIKRKREEEEKMKRVGEMMNK